MAKSASSQRRGGIAISLFEAETWGHIRVWRSGMSGCSVWHTGRIFVIIFALQLFLHCSEYLFLI
jgi:hypothetical protein